jgi:hypothetical protein
VQYKEGDKGKRKVERRGKGMKRNMRIKQTEEGRKELTMTMCCTPIRRDGDRDTSGKAFSFAFLI